MSGAGADAAAPPPETQEVVQRMQRDVNCLADNSKMTRKRSVTKLRKVLLDEGHPPAMIQHIFAVILVKPLLKLFVDPVEKIRELSIEFFDELVKQSTDPSVVLPYAIPVIADRMGQQEIEEESEEVRLLLVQVLVTFVRQCPSELKLYIDDYISVLQRTVVDPFPDVMKLSCGCISELAVAIPQQFHGGSKPLHKPLIASSCHQHSKVRVACIQGIESVCLFGANDAINDFVVRLAQLSMDKSPGVRRALYTATGHWMLDLKDRYSFWYKLLTIMLNGVGDEVPEIAQLCTEKFHAAGRQWEKENEDDIKDMMDFGSGAALDRPPLGCRILVDREISKILPGLLRDICDWTEGVRLQSAKLLLCLLQYAEDKATMHLEKLLTGYFKSVRDEEQAVSDVVVQCVEVTGKWTKVSDWVDTLLPRLKAKGVSSSEQISHLIVIGGLIRGARAGAAAPFLVPIAEALEDEEVCAAQVPELLDELLLLFSDMIDAADDELPFEQSAAMFNAMLNARAACPHVDAEFEATMRKLAEVQGMESVDGLYVAHTKALLQRLHGTHTEWSKHSHDRRTFDALLLRAGGTVGAEIDVVMEILICNFQVDKDPEIRLSFFALLSKLLGKPAESLNSADGFTFAEAVMLQIVIPNCTWQNGRVPAALRTAASTCLWALLQSGLVSNADINGAIAEVMPQLVSLLDDTYEDTRMVITRVVEQLLRVYPQMFNEGYECYDRLHSLYPELLKRLDDNSDDIRLGALTSWLAWAKVVSGKPYDTDLYRAHLEACIGGLMIHLDDPEPRIQDAVAAVLREFAAVDPRFVAAAATAGKAKHRDAARCAELASYAEGLQKAA